MVYLIVIIIHSSPENQVHLYYQHHIVIRRKDTNRAIAPHPMGEALLLYLALCVCAFQRGFMRGLVVVHDVVRLLEDVEDGAVFIGVIIAQAHGDGGAGNGAALL